MSNALEAGAVLAGKYRLVAPLGSGGMGTVWRADHLVLHSPVAVKVLNERAQDSAHGPTRFLREAQAAAALRSPHVVQILDVGMEGTVPFIVMEMLEGESLAARLRRVGRLDLATTTQVVTETARALHKAHEAGIVHRDLKPDNIFLVRDVDRDIVKVLDFGIAKLVEQMEVEQLTGTGSVLGTPHYMSPEQARGRREVDHRTDLWALGVIAYECTTGRRPYDSHALGDLLMQICTEDAAPPSGAGGLPAELDSFMARALARDPAQRFGSALEMADSFARLAGVGPMTQPAAYAPLGSAQGAAQGAVQGAVQGAAQGAVQSAVQGAAQSAVQGAAQGAAPSASGPHSSAMTASVSWAPPSGAGAHSGSGSLPPGSGFGSASHRAAELAEVRKSDQGVKVLLLGVGLVLLGAVVVIGAAVGIVVYTSEGEATASAAAPTQSAPVANREAEGAAPPSTIEPAPGPGPSPKSAGAAAKPTPTPTPAPGA
ncbi:MAG TPA: protein kinase, partial [Polyangiaceae bacterium]|nr:protein kinase [Polyangiaceae bacterium]